MDGTETRPPLRNTEKPDIFRLSVLSTRPSVTLLRKWMGSSDERNHGAQTDVGLLQRTRGRSQSGDVEEVVAIRASDEVAVRSSVGGGMHVGAALRHAVA